MKAVCAALLICLAASASPVAAQRQEKTPCPAVKITGPTDDEIFTMLIGTGLMMFTAEVNGRRPDDSVAVKWSVSGGKIITGEGTPIITVEADRSLHVQCVTVSAEFDELETGCGRTASWRSLVPLGIVETLGQKFDEYGDIPLKEEKKRLDTIGLHMPSVPIFKLRIVGHDGPNRRNEAAAWRAERARDYLIKKHGIEAGRIVLGPRTSADLPLRYFALELWLEPREEMLYPPCEEKR